MLLFHRGTTAGVNFSKFSNVAAKVSLFGTCTSLRSLKINLYSLSQNKFNFILFCGVESKTISKTLDVWVFYPSFI